MRLTNVLVLMACYAFCMVSFNGSVQGATVAETAKKFENSFIELAKPTRRRGRGRPGFSIPADPIDLIFVIDRSGSIGQSNFGLSLKFVEEALNYWSISPSTTRVAAISYSHTIRNDFLFNAHVNRECVVKAVREIDYSRGGTATGVALQRAQLLYQTSSNSGTRPSAKKVIFVLTDGRSNTGVTPSIPAGQLKAAGVEIHALGIGNNIRESELNTIATSTDNVYHLPNFAALQQMIDRLSRQSRVKCTGPEIQYDECGRRCKCSGGKLIECCRVRKDFPSMSTIEKERFVSAYKTVSTQQPYKARYDALVQTHVDNFWQPIHDLPEFLPWHRWYLLQFENLLREVDCRVTMPYWDWSLWSHNPWSGSHVWSSIGNQGVGGNGNPSQGMCVTTGPFGTPGWSTSSGPCLRRTFNGNVPDAADIQTCLNHNSFTAFELYLRVSLHNPVHGRIGGTMSSTGSAGAPEFQLHHGFVDKIWSDWQKLSPANLNAYFPGINTRMTATNYYPRDLIDLTKQPGCVRVCYEDPTINSGKRVKTFLQSLSPSQLSRLPRMPFTATTKADNDRFGVSKADRALAKRLEAIGRRGVLRGRSARINFKNQLERTLGFQLIAPPHIRPIRPIGPIRPPGRPRPPAPGGFKSSLAEDEVVTELDLEAGNAKDFVEEQDGMNSNYAEKENLEFAGQKNSMDLEDKNAKDTAVDQHYVNADFAERGNEGFAEQANDIETKQEDFADQEDAPDSNFAEHESEDFAEQDKENNDFGEQAPTSDVNVEDVEEDFEDVEENFDEDEEEA